ncbi:MAG: SpoIIE family protein phosphatase [Lachnospiraceae bacterium]|nr:SpoIIE family protein phosphatase [Lachnospiraceae bacterium]
MNKKKPKLSILFRIVLMVILALIASTIITSGLVNRIVMDYATRQGEDLAQTTAAALKTVIASTEGYDALAEDASYREKIHKVCRYFCETCAIQNLYIYTIDENRKKHIIVIASADDEDDRELNEVYGFGSDRSRPLFQVEKDILDGNTEADNNPDTDGDYEYIINEYGNLFTYVIPVRDDDGEIYCFIGVDFTARRITDIADEDFRMLYAIRIVFALSIFLILIILLRRLVTKPIQNLSKEMRSYVRDREYSRKRRVRRTIFDDEVTDIEASFNEMVEDISGYLGDIENLTRERIQNQTQFEIARSIQCGIIPDEYTLSGAGYDISGVEKPAKEVGGDFYDIFRTDEGRICVVVGDISGKGLYAALFMVLVKTELREKLKAGKGLAVSLMEVNRDICLANTANMFATIFVSLLDTKTGRLTYANAGHNRPLLICSEPHYIDVNSGTAIGLFDDIEITEDEIELKSGEGLMIYSDGVTEAIDKDKVLFGEERLSAAVKESLAAMESGRNSMTPVKNVISAVSEHSKDMEQFDDITCAAVCYMGSEQETETLSPEIASFSHIRNTVLGSLGNNKTSRNIILVCEEIFTNIISYSGADNLHYFIYRSGNTYAVTFSDNGIPFDPVNSPLPEKDFDELDTGGMGIKLARLKSREMTYHRENGRNHLTLKFDLT